MSLEKLLRAPMERPKDQKADQKRCSPGTSFGDEVCSDFGFIEAALKCLHTANKFCNRIQCHAREQATDFDGRPAASRSAMPCSGARPPLADSAPSMPEIAPFIVPT